MGDDDCGLHRGAAAAARSAGVQGGLDVLERGGAQQGAAGHPRPRRQWATLYAKCQQSSGAARLPLLLDLKRAAQVARSAASGEPAQQPEAARLAQHNGFKLLLLLLRFYEKFVFLPLLARRPDDAQVKELKQQVLTTSTVTPALEQLCQTVGVEQARNIVHEFFARKAAASSSSSSSSSK